MRLALLAIALVALGCGEQRPVQPAPQVPVQVPGPVPSPYPPAIAQRMQAVEARSRLRERMAELRVPGVSVAVVDHGAIVWARGYGVADAQNGGAVTSDTLFQAASVSKPVAAMGALRLVGEGKLALDQDVNTILRGWKLPIGPEANGRPVTLRMLLSHSGGVTVHGFRGYAQGEPVPSLLDVLNGQRPANSAPIRVDSPPGEKHRYSGGGFVVVQAMMIDVTGAPFDAVMQQEVLGPLGMMHSTYTQPLPVALWSTAATGHRESGEPLRGRWFTHPEMAPAGLWTTPSDLARVLLEVMAASAGAPSRVLSQPLANLMMTRQSGSAGLGFMLAGHDDRLRFSHGGSNQGFRCGVEGVLRTGQGAVVMTNGDGGGKVAGDVIAAIAAEYGWPPTSDAPRVSSADWIDDDADDGALAAAD